MKTILVFFILISVGGLCSAREKDSVFGESIWLIEGRYMMSAIKSNGWGLGVSYEQQILDSFSVKGYFSHMTMRPKNGDIYVVTVGININAFYYPFRQGLKWLYIGGGMGTDFLMYNGDTGQYDEKDSVITAYPMLGWKHNFKDYVRIDVSASYRFLLNNEKFPDFAENAYITGFEYGINCSVNAGLIIKRFILKK